MWVKLEIIELCIFQRYIGIIHRATRRELLCVTSTFSTRARTKLKGGELLVRGGDWISESHQLVVRPGFVGNLGRLSDPLPDLPKDHCLLRVVLPDLLILLAQYLSHSCHLRVEGGVFHFDMFELPLHLVKLFPVRPMCQLSEDVSGAVVVQCYVGSPTDVLQPVVWGLEVRQIVVHPLEGVFRKLPCG